MAFLSTSCRFRVWPVQVKKGSKTIIAFGIFLLCLLFEAPANPGRYQQVRLTARPFIPVVQEYLRRGDHIYAQKGGYECFRQSLYYFDRANALAQHLHDTALLAETTCALARVYDAWNEDPQKTISLLQQSLTYMEAASSDMPRRYYTRYLLAHAHLKAAETDTAFSQLEALLARLSASDTALLRKMPFTVEMAFTAVEAGNIELADRILSKLTRREWIANDPQTYNYLDHYYLIRAYTEWAKGKPETPYLDSFKQTLKTEPVLFQKMYYAQLLADFYKLKGDYPLAFRYLEQARTLNLLMHTGAARNQLSRSLAYTETNTLNRRQHLERNIRSVRVTALWVLGGLLLVISVLSFYLYGRNRKVQQQSKLLQQTNQVLDEKVMQVELLNQEVEHRVKNNLYAIRSLLELQSRQAPGEEIAASLQIAQMRVNSIAMLHNMLLQGRGILIFEAYAQALFESIIACYADEREVSFSLEIEECPLPEKAYSPLSLILNEWVTNSVKYAQPAAGRLHLFLSLKTIPLEGTVIAYHDNGVLPPGHEEPVTGLGSKIIAMLARQMGATLFQKSLFYYQITLPHEREN